MTKKSTKQEREFYKTVLTLTFISAWPIEETSDVITVEDRAGVVLLEDFAQEIDTLTGKEVVDEIAELNVGPERFDLDAKGNDL